MKNKFLIIFIFFCLQLELTADNSNDFFLSANQVLKDDKNQIIKASGSVQIQKGKVKIISDTLIYKINIKEIKLKGNIKIFSESGDIIFAKEAVLNESLKSGVIKNLGLLMSDDSRLAASSANTVEDESRSIYKNIVFTKCLQCDKNKEALWQLKAKKATHLKKSKIILYESVFLEVFDIPLIYVPLFYHPDPTVKRKTGLLTPKVSSSSIFGYSYEQPVYINLSKKSDFTFSPKLTTKEGIILDNNYRRKSDTGELKFRASITKGTKVRKDEPSKKEVRGHLDFKFANMLKNNWLIGANLKRASDKSYLTRYKISSGETLLTQNLFLEKGDILKNVSLETYKFQSLSNDYLKEELPFVRPLIIYDWSNLNNKKRNRDKSLTFSARSISKNNDDYTNALHLKFRDEKKYLLGGALLNNFYNLNFDYYRTNTINDSSDSTYRLIPEIGTQYQYPFIRRTSKSSYIFEPVVQAMLSHESNKSEKIKNEDSLEIELTSSNLFETNKYSGFDRIEEGFRINYGFLYKILDNVGNSFTSSLGRAFYARNQNNFEEKNGFSENNSEIVGNITFNTKKNTEVYYKFRLSDEFDLKKNRLKSSFKFLDTDFNISFMQRRDFASSNNSDTEQITFGFKKKILKKWELSFSQFRDLASALYSSPLSTSIGIGFENECVSLRMNLTKDKLNAVDIPASTNLSFTFDLFSM